MFSLSKGQRQQPPNSAASVGGAPASSAVAAAPAETSAAEPANSGTVPSAAPITGVVGAREPSDGAVSSDAVAEAVPSTGDTAAPVASAARAARALASTAGSADDSWAWPIARGVCDFIPEREYRCGNCHLGRAPFRGVRRPARVWYIRGARGDIATRDQHYLGQVGVFLEE